MITKINKEQFNEIINIDDIKVVLFTAPWCGPSGELIKMLSVVDEKIDKYNIYNVDIDEIPTSIEKFSLEVVPSIVVLKKDVVIDIFIGYMQKEVIIENIEKGLEKVK